MKMFSKTIAVATKKAFEFFEARTRQVKIVINGE